MSKFTNGLNAIARDLQAHGAMMKASAPAGGPIQQRPVQAPAVPVTGFDLIKAQLGLGADGTASVGRVLANGEVAERVGPGNKMSADEFLDLAMEAVARGHLTTTQLSTAEFQLRAGKLPEPAVVRAVLTKQKYSPF